MELEGIIKGLVLAGQFKLAIKMMLIKSLIK
jgi:hypothetical protein